MKTKYIIPDNTQLLKISSFYVNLNDDIYRVNTIKLITKYIFSDFYNLEIDIICIQGINEEKLVKMMVSEILNLSNELKIPVNIVPKIDPNTTNSLDNSIQLVWNNSHFENYENYENNDVNSIIISKYPIITTSKISLNDSMDEKLVGSRKAIIANINVNGYLLSVYSVTLSEDYLGVSNEDFRKNEISELCKFIDLNNIEMKKINESYDLNLINKNINIICGNLNVSEIKNLKINPELLQICKTLKALDTFRVFNFENQYINKNGFKDCYILLLLTDFSTSDNLTKNEILNYSYNKYGITVIKSVIITNITSNDYHPIETIFLLNRSEKKNYD